MGDSVNHFENPDSPTVLLRRLHRWRMAFFGLVILLAGMLSGAAITLLLVGPVDRQLPPPPVRVVTEMLARLGPRLHLTEAQSTQLEPVLQRHVQRLQEIEHEGRTAIVEELTAMNEQMAAVLDENQMRQWQQLLEGLPGQMRHVPGGFGPGPGGQGAGHGFGGGRFGPGRGGQGPMHVAPEGPFAPDANTTSPH